MKKILIAILVVILLIFGYNQYKDYKRFHPEQVNYKTTQTIDLNYHNQDVVYNYYEAIEVLNHYILSQWTANAIDVRNPEVDNEEQQYANKQYAKKLAKVKYFEAKLAQSSSFKSSGLDNEKIKFIEENNISIEEIKVKEKQIAFKKMMIEIFPKNNLFFGQKSAFIYELQKLLVKKGFEIPADGVYKSATSDAILQFELKKGLFADGKIDKMTLDALID